MTCNASSVTIAVRFGEKSMAKNLQICNRRSARTKWGSLATRGALASLTVFTEDYGFSVVAGDLLILEASWYVTHAGLVRLAHRSGCAGIHVEPVAEFSNMPKSRWAFKATVYKSRTCKGFVGYGDADPSNVSALVRGAEMRVAETRAVNRALRKAYGIGLCSVEEIGSADGSSHPAREPRKIPPQSTNGKGFGSPPLVRDRLCQLIRQHQLDPNSGESLRSRFLRDQDLERGQPGAGRGLRPATF